MPKMTGGIKTGRFSISLPNAETEEIDRYIKESGMYRACFLSYALTVGTRVIERQRTHIDVQQAPSQAPVSNVVRQGDFSGANHHEDVTTQQERASMSLKQIAPEQRALLELLYFDGLSMSEVATRLGLPLASVKALAIQAVRQLNSRLNESRTPDT